MFIFYQKEKQSKNTHLLVRVNPPWNPPRYTAEKKKEIPDWRNGQLNSQRPLLSRRLKLLKFY
jgi:hypothetical protein